MPLPITEHDGKIDYVKLFNGQGFGLESDDFLNAKKKFAIRVSDNNDYMISFWIKQSTLDPSLELSLTSFNCEFDTKLISKNIQNGVPETFFVKSNEKITSIPNRYSFCRFILYSKNQQIQSSQPKTSLGMGRNLIMAPSTANVFVNLKCVKDTINIWNFKVRPLRTPFSTGFVGNNNLLEIWRKNNKKHMSNEDIDNIAKNYLLPYNAIPAVINL